LAVGHEHVNEKSIETFINHQLIVKIKDKFTFKQDLNCNNLLLTTTGRKTALLKHDSDDLETILVDQGGSVIPDHVTVHEIERPETHD
jgi:hypothetical protein